MKKSISIMISILVILFSTNLHQAHAISVNYGGALLINPPYPYSHNDSFFDPDEIDFYKFQANPLDLVTIDIDNGFDGRDGGVITPGQDVDTILSLFYDNEGDGIFDMGDFIPYNTFGLNCPSRPLFLRVINADDAGCAIDPGSYVANPFSSEPYTKDPFITYTIPSGGDYYIAVTVADNGIVSGAFSGVSNRNNAEYRYDTSGRLGTYTLVVDVTPVPEPSTGILLAIGLLGLFAVSLFPLPLWERVRKFRTNL